MKFRKWIIWLLIIALVLSLPAIAFARAGGGESSGGGSGGSGSSGSYGDSYSRGGYYGGYGYYNPFLRLISWIIIPILACAGFIAFRMKLLKAKGKSREQMAKYDDNDPAWKYKSIQGRVEDAFYAIQFGWRDRDLTKAKKYLSERMYDQVSTKIEWMKYQDRRNIMENIRLLSIKPVMTHDDQNDDNDYVWFYINAKMTDYIVDEKTMERISGSLKCKSFVEYWKFKRECGEWVLHEIMQEADGTRQFLIS